MNRRGFLRGLLATTAVAATGSACIPRMQPWKPALDARPIHGTVTGRLSAKQVMFARAYGAGEQKIRMHAGGQQISRADYAALERRLMAHYTPSNRHDISDL